MDASAPMRMARQKYRYTYAECEAYYGLPQMSYRLPQWAMSSTPDTHDTVEQNFGLAGNSVVNLKVPATIR